MTDIDNAELTRREAREARQARRDAEADALAAGAEDHVELGSAADVPEGEAIALRHYSEHHGAGVPTTDDAPAYADDDDESKGRVARTIASLKSYREIGRTPHGYGPFIILGGITFFQTFDTQAFNVAAPDIVRDLQVRIGTLISIQREIGIVLLFVTLYVGWWADRHRRAPMLAAGTMVSGLGGMFSSKANTMGWLGAGRVLDDTAFAVGDVPEFSLLADYYPPETRGKVFAGLGTIFRVGALMAVFMVGFVIEHFGWRTALFSFAAPLVPMGLVALFVLREPVRGYFERSAMGADAETATHEDEPVSFGEAWRATLQVRTLRRLAIAEVFTSCGVVLYGLYFQFYLAEKYHLDAFARSLFGLPTLLAALGAGLYGGALIDRFTRRNPGRVLAVLGAFRVLAGIGVVIVALHPPLVVLVLSSMVVGAGSALIGPAANVVFAQVVPSNIRTQGLQIANLSALPAYIVATPILSQIFDKNGYGPVFMAMAPFYVLGAIIVSTAGSFFDIDARTAFAASVAADEWRRAKTEGRSKLLVARDVDVAYDGVQVLFGVDFDVEEGQIIALLGTNGAGKSTLLRAISGTTEASSGAIVFDGRDITHMPPHEIAGRGVVHMPGGRGVFPGLTVRDNLVLALYMEEDPAEIRRRLNEVLEIFPILNERLDTSASSLSGGEQQQLSLAQAFLAKPKLLLIDELSLGLSPAVVGQLLDVVREIHRRGVTIVVVEQSVNVALTIAQKAIFMEKGEVKFFGNTADLLARPDILRAVYVKGTGALTEGAPAGARRSERELRALELGEARPVLEVRELTKRYGGVTAVDGTSFDVREGEVLGLIGPNGAGKTTIFDLISGYQAPDSGRVVFDGVDVTDMSAERRAQLKMIRRFQDARLFPSLTVFETLLVALEQQLQVRSTVLNAMGMPQARRAERRLRVRAERLVELLELGAYRDKFVKELSTGLRRIADLACVLAAEPRLLLLDEPSSGIAQAEAESLAPLLRRIRFETGCTILIIEHDMPLISAVSDELIALERGQVLLRGSPTDVLNDERVIESYLGTSEAAVNRSGRAE
jgi:branched-chain amino acid transport system ATP-binding protein